MPLPWEWRHGTWRGHYARGHTTQVREAPSTKSAVPGYLDSHAPQPHPSEAFRSSLSQNSLAHSTSAHCSQLHLSLSVFHAHPYTRSSSSRNPSTLAQTSEPADTQNLSILSSCLLHGPQQATGSSCCLYMILSSWLPSSFSYLKY
jgi:hypothetical protein